ncbi:enoyl-CoA hydratase-related protein [Dactylosporangium sp. NPDC005572]|uniref:enoyl-CoA hydratase/isomerase family protein n=1 Tax=Dactylosporangium sp. NPDC005572 TaxID=3156889 RepID=UPI0033B728E8
MDIEYDVSDHVATITLNRPHQRNAFTLGMIEHWAQMLRQAESDPEVRAVVLTGVAGSFCSGVDLAEFANRERSPLAERNLLTERVHMVAHAAEALSKPYLAAVGGPAVGAGMDMALMADLRMAGTSATFCQGYIRVGLVPGDGGCYYLPRIVGMATALRLMWTAEVVDAEQAVRIGLVSSVHPDNELADACQTLARKLAGMPPVAVRLIKRAAYASQHADLRGALELIAAYQAVMTSTEDSAEAMEAFLNRRPAQFRGR